MISRHGFPERGVMLVRGGAEFLRVAADWDRELGAPAVLGLDDDATELPGWLAGTIPLHIEVEVWSDDELLADAARAVLTGRDVTWETVEYGENQ